GGNMVVLPHTSKNIPYDPLKDFAPISVTTFNYLAIVANPEAPFKTIGEMVRYAKANPGKLTVATNGEGGFPHLAFEHLRTMAGFTYTHVPYKGSAAIATDIIGGQVQAGIDGITGMTPHIKSGRLRVPDIAEKLEAAGLIIRTEPPEFFAQVLKSDFDKYGKLVKDIGFQPQ